MTIRTTYSGSAKFSVEIDGDVIFQNSQTPEGFYFNVLGASPMFIGRKKLTFFSGRKYFVEDTAKVEVASISINSWVMGWTGRVFLDFNGTRFRVTALPKKWYAILTPSRAWKIEGLGIECRMDTSFVGCEIVSVTSGADQREIAVTLLLHYFELVIWRESD